MTTQTFSYTGADQSFAVPAGVTTITIKLWGAGGGPTAVNPTENGGAGAFVQGDLTVTPGDTLKVVVGQGGDVNVGSRYGGGGACIPTGYGSGGGYSGVFLTSVSFANAKAIAGAGGGASVTGNPGQGAGGIANGHDGVGGTPGIGGSQIAGGAFGGGQLLGGNGNVAGHGAGGGGGYFGGGAGQSTSGPAGGGSSYIALLTSVSTAVSSDGFTAPNTGDTNYPGGNVGYGGVEGSTAGGNGYVVFIYTVPSSSAQFSGSGQLSGSAAVYKQAVAAFAGSSGLSVSAALAMVAGGQFNGIGSLTANTIRLSPDVLFKGSGALGATGYLALRSLSRLDGAGSLGAYASLNVLANTALFAGVGGLSANTLARLRVAATFGGAGMLSALPFIGLRGAATFHGASLLSALAVLHLANTGLFRGVGSMVIPGSVLKFVFVDFNGVGKLCVHASVRLGPTGATTNIVRQGPGPTNNLVV